MAPVSAVIPCYRCAGTLRRAVASVAAQSARPLELILVNDGDQGDTAAAIAAIAAEHGGRVRVVALAENRGAAAARNAGWDAARGELVAFLDADDTWMPEKLERQVAFMREHPEFGLTGHNALYAAGGRAPFPAFHLDAPYREISRGELLLRNRLVTPSLMARRALAVRFDPSSRHMEDHRFLQEAAFSGIRIAAMREALAQVHKAPYGEGGLSAELHAMAAADLANYRKLRADGHIGTLGWLGFAALSRLRYLRRLLRVAWSRAASPAR
jgi:glycosyltransferase involved in cell wall biosynthesis